MNETFTDILFKYIDESRKSDSEIYKKANVDRRLFSKIRSGKRIPSKITIICLSLALQLSVKDTNLLLSKAGYILSDSLPFDKIITRCLRENIYDVITVNNILYENGCKTLVRW